MKSWRNDRSGGLLGLAALLLVLLMLAYAVSVMFPNVWHDLTEMVSRAWPDIHRMISKIWDVFTGWLDKHL
jgi:hypothetical protein